MDCPVNASPRIPLSFLMCVLYQVCNKKAQRAGFTGTEVLTVLNLIPRNQLESTRVSVSPHLTELCDGASLGPLEQLDASEAPMSLPVRKAASS